MTLSLAWCLLSPYLLLFLQFGQIHKTRPSLQLSSAHDASALDRPFNNMVLIEGPTPGLFSCPSIALFRWMATMMTVPGSDLLIRPSWRNENIEKNNPYKGMNNACIQNNESPLDNDGDPLPFPSYKENTNTDISRKVYSPIQHRHPQCLSPSIYSYGSGPKPGWNVSWGCRPKL